MSRSKHLVAESVPHLHGGSSRNNKRLCRVLALQEQQDTPTTESHIESSSSSDSFHEINSAILARQNLTQPRTQKQNAPRRHPPSALAESDAKIPQLEQVIPLKPQVQSKSLRLLSFPYLIPCSLNTPPQSLFLLPALETQNPTSTPSTQPATSSSPPSQPSIITPNGGLLPEVRFLKPGQAVSASSGATAKAPGTPFPRCGNQAP